MTATSTLSSTIAAETSRRSPYGAQIAGLMSAAFTLSVGHTIYAWAAGIEDPEFTVTSPVAWIFYAVAFAVTALARRAQRWAQVAVAGFLVLSLHIGVFYYPTRFGPEQQTTFGWFENDVYLGLLIVALYLTIQRLRGVTLTPRR
jgi:hypothetical protein